ncbi:tRNA pseudouridine synthase 1 [Xylographa trunciseda]|nr:tRNA pseudouridine synthase 1 [Xylographa trunciseda]
MEASSTTNTSNEALNERSPSLTEPSPSSVATPSHTRGRGRGNPRSRGATRGRGDRKKRQDVGRSEWARKSGDRRARNDAAQESAKRQRLDDGTPGRKPVYAVDFSKEEIEGEERRPKRKVAVMIGYSGSGYKGMQLNDKEKTIEGDLFQAFVAAGAVSKANADDPKKSALVRCARTDKGVHAAGNVISMKLIIEDPDIVQKINDNLSPQIRVWGIVRTNASFSAYQLCDSRIYEYLIPSHCFLPPHPESYLGKKLVELAEEVGDLEGYRERQEEVATFWAETEEQYIKPFLETLDLSIRQLVLDALYHNAPADKDEENRLDRGTRSLEDDPAIQDQPMTEKENQTKHAANADHPSLPQEGDTNTAISLARKSNPDSQTSQAQESTQAPPRPTSPDPDQSDPSANNLPDPDTQEAKHPLPTAVETALRTLRHALIAAKNAYRLPAARLSRIRSALALYNGTHSFHNYTVAKSARDPSAQRIIKSFTLAPAPLLINGTEWLSLRVHGQSFMMHQIRKMVSMAALVVRCGCPPGRIAESYGPLRMVVPKAPGLGLLLERPVFESYNARGRGEGRAEVGFEGWEGEMGEWKQREIYERIFREEERDRIFHVMFSNIDNFRSAQLLYLSSKGVAACEEGGELALAGRQGREAAVVEGESEDEDGEPEDG